MASGYWEKMLLRRISRRRALAAAGGGALGAVALSACGGEREATGVTGAGKGSDLILTPVDTTKSGKHGGIIKSYITNFPASFDVMNWPFGLSIMATIVGSQLTRYKPGRLEDPELGSVGDIVQDWEYTPDKLTLTMKIHPRAKWSPLSPTFHAGAPQSIGGRKIDADDILFSWERWKNHPSAFRRLEVIADLPNSLPSAAVISIAKIDDATIQFKLKKPYAALIQSFSNWEAGSFYVYPKEGASQGANFFDKYAFGAGPYYYDKAEPSVGMFLKRNPFYEERQEFKLPFADGVDLPQLSDPAAVQGQLRVGNIWHQGLFALRAEEILNLKRDVPELVLTLSVNDDPEVFYFGIHKDSPFKDERVRLAMSYAWDRDTFIQVVHKTDVLEKAGIPTDVRWNAALPSQETGMPNGLYKGWWLNPKDPKVFGENAKYFTLGQGRDADIREAKRLLQAATGKDTLSFDFFYSSPFPTSAYSTDVLQGIIASAGFNMLRKNLTVAEFGAQVTTGVTPPGNYIGASIGIDGGGSHDPGQYITNHYRAKGSFWRGLNPSGDGPSAEGDPKINAWADQILEEFDERKRKEIAFEFQRYHAAKNYRPRFPGSALTIENPGQGHAYGVAWPVLQNQNVWTGESFPKWWCYEWIDETKPPLNRKA